MRSPARRPQHVAGERGLTLLEMLVTLVIVALVATILGQALAQLARVERLLESGQLRSATDSLRAEWVRDALAGLLPGGNERELVRGSEREIEGLSSAVPQIPAPGVARLHLRLVTDVGLNQTRLEMLREGKQAGDAVVLLRWPGPGGRFRYLDAQARWHDQWPLPAASAPGLQAEPTLPKAIALETGSENLGSLLAQPVVSSVPLPDRHRLEAM